MKITREKEMVQAFHFDMRNLRMEKEKGAPKTQVQVEFQIRECNEEKKETSLFASLRFMIVLNRNVISGRIMQGNFVHDRLVADSNEFSEEEKRELADPLLDMLKRLTYEVTEIAFDQPGVDLKL